MKATTVDDRTAKRLQKIMKAKVKEVILPPFWRLHDAYGVCSVRWVLFDLSGNTAGVVILEPEIHDDDPQGGAGGIDWWHLSVSRTTRLPTWDELVQAKECFLGVNARAMQIIPPRSEYVNIDPHVLHLFARIDGKRVLPDFRLEGGGI